MRLTIFIGFSLCFLACGTGIDQQARKQQGMSYIFDNIIIQKDVVYGTEDTTQQQMDIYLHGQLVGEPKWAILDTSKHKVLIYIHGGGWLGGDKADNVFQFVPFLEKGFNLFSLNYRMGLGTAPDAAEDVICALRWIVDRANEYHLDTDQIYITGGSAGGHLSLVMGFAPTSGKAYICDVGDIKVRGIINQFGITEIEENNTFLATYKPEWNYTGAWIGDKNRISEISEKYSPVYMASDRSPPVLTIHGSVDSVVPYAQALKLDAVLKEKSLNHKLITIDGGNHGGFKDAGWDLMMNEAFQFIEDTQEKVN